MWGEQCEISNVGCNARRDATESNKIFILLRNSRDMGLNTVMFTVFVVYESYDVAHGTYVKQSFAQVIFGL